MATVPSSARRATFATLASLSLVFAVMSPAVPQTLGGFNDSTLQRESLKTPESLADGLVEGLQFADPESGLAAIAPPEANGDGGAQISYPLLMPNGRGLTPEITLDYDSGGVSSWVGYGWDLSVGDVSVDTSFGAPLFCPRSGGGSEPELRQLRERVVPAQRRPGSDGRAHRPSTTRGRAGRLHAQGGVPSTSTSSGTATRRRTTSGRSATSPATSPGTAGSPTLAGPFGAPGTRTGAEKNDRSRDSSSILADNAGNASRWSLKAQRDVGVNMIRYEYDSVFYQAEDSADGVAWTKISESKCNNDDDIVCGKHIYLSKVFYTGAAEASGQPEASAYEVEFVRGARRPDPVIDGRGGVLDVDVEKLTAVVVRFNKPNGDQVKVVRYDLETATGQFGKTMLNAVHQTGCATDNNTCVDSTEATHDFKYYDDVNGQGFADPSTWNTRDDDLGDGRLEGQSGALGMSESNAGDGHVCIGFNPVAPTKVGSFGGSLTFDGADTESLVEFLDINGDTLPDKVFSQDGKVWTHLNTSNPGDALDTQVTFEATKREIKGLDDLPKETEFGVGGGVEAFFGVSVMFNAGGSWNWSKGYFSDVNGDGLMDWVKDSSVLFNHLECSGDPEVCVPVFNDSDGETRAPLNIRPVSGAADESLEETLALLRRLSPPVTLPPLGRAVRRHGSDRRARHVRRGHPDRLHRDRRRTSCPAAQRHGDRPLCADRDRTRLGRPVHPGVEQGRPIYFRLGPDPALPSTLVEVESPDHLHRLHPLLGNGRARRERQGPGAVRRLRGLRSCRPPQRVRRHARSRHDSLLRCGREAGDQRLRAAQHPALPRQRAEHVDLRGSGGDRGRRPGATQTRPARSSWCSTGASGATSYPNGTQFACFPSQSAAESHLTVLFPSETGRFRVDSQFGVERAHHGLERCI